MHFKSMYVICSLLFITNQTIHGQINKTYRFNLEWDSKSNEENTIKYLSFKGGFLNDLNPDMDIFSESIPVDRNYEVSVEIKALRSEIVSDVPISVQNITDVFKASADIIEVRKNFFINVSFLPVKINTDKKLERLLDFEVVFNLTPIFTSGQRGPLSVSRSVLADGDVYKISVDKTGIYKIDRSFLETRLGINVAAIDPKKIKIYGNGGGMLPEANASKRIDDLVENRIFIEGEQDGRFDANDYILFYAQGPDIWKYNAAQNDYQFEKNIYDNNNYYFLKISSEDGLRIQNLTPPIQDALAEFGTYDFLQRFESDRINLLGSQSGTYGTGKEWYGDNFRTTRERVYTGEFDFSGLDIAQDLKVKMSFAARSAISSSITLSVGERNTTRSVSAVNITNLEATYANKIIINESFKINTINPVVRLAYPNVSRESDGWLDYIQIVNKRNIQINNNQLAFRNAESANFQTISFLLPGFTNQSIWDVSDISAPKSVSVVNGKIKFETNGINREFISFNAVSGTLVPIALGKIPNQNLHAINDENMIVVYHPSFKPAVDKFVNHRQSHSNLKILAAEINQVYNEFSSGKVDPSAIRDMARMLLQRNSQFKYLLLFGDGSYDYKNLMPNLNNENFVPVYQTDQSLNPISGFPSDDYFGLLGDNEGVGLKGGMDLYIGRFPVKTLEEAEAVVTKVIHYDTSPLTFGDWRLRKGFAADDEDFNLHLRDMDEIARDAEVRDPQYNQQKVYFDAFRQVSTPGENRYPDANRVLNNNVFKGQVVLTYLGHGGFNGWAQERVLTVSDIQKWDNLNSLLLMVTATCSFAAYDDPAITSPAEYAFLNPKGGAIALFSTTRAVFTSSNKQLTAAVHNLMFQKIDNNAPTFGYILSEGKNRHQGDFFIENSRKFTLIGDPSQPIAMPKFEVVTTKINGRQTTSQTDTLRALTKVTIEGFIANTDGSVLESFNGTVFPTVFDKKVRQLTLGNDKESPIFPFESYRNIIFKGSASVVNGQWSFSFWIPKDINYSIGNGRISLYATDGFTTDAGGYFSGFSIGGTSENLLADDKGPDIELYLNDENFVFGGLTNANPVLIVNLEDDFGINVTGNSIGHDITAILDDDNQNIFILNDFYEATKDDFRSGKVRFPLSNLSKGQHSLKVKAWDISNNSTEQRTEFIVADTEKEILKHVLNYPNPFTTFTKFNFEHDLANTELDILINIYTISGKLVKTIHETKFTSGFRVNDISWNGRDDFESKLAKGLYLYKVKVISKDLNVSRESGFEKLIIL